MKTTTTTTLAAFAALAISANAAFVVVPTAQSGASDNIINGSGINTPELIETGDPVPATWPTITTPNSDTGIWRGSWIGDTIQDITGTANVDLTLGAAYTVEGIYWWGSNRSNTDPSRATQTAGFYYSTDGGANYTSITVANDVDLITYPEDAVAVQQGQYIDFGGSIAGVTHVRVDQLTASGYAGTINEIRIVAVPEPSSLALLGLGGLALLRRRRK